jgi:NitT/TauT family transport system substrate-binding protein
MILVALGTGCGSGEKQPTIRIAEQYGLAYAPLQVMREQQLLEKALPEVTIEWKQFGGPTPIREAMVAGEVDFGFMGPAPVLVGLDNGMKWKYATGLSFNEVALVTDREDIKTLKDIGPGDRIAILSPGSTQHILLCIASQQAFGDPNYFDNQIVSLSHPDAMDALMADTEIVAHFSTPPYLGQELDQGMHVIVTGEEIMGGPFTFITGVTLEAFYQQHPDYYEAILDALKEAIDYINENMEEASRLLAPIYGVPQEELLKQMSYQGTIYSTRLVGLQKLADQMLALGLIKTPVIIEEVTIDEIENQ